jgi:cytidine deaminase
MHKLQPHVAEELATAALEARRHAYAKYSGFAVGAALLVDDRRIFQGTNVENASYGLTICAERAAVFAAVSAGCRQFRAIAVATPRGDAPCGACRQVLAEFAPDLCILLVAAEGDRPLTTTHLSALLPSRFELENK